MGAYPWILQFGAWTSESEKASARLAYSRFHDPVPHDEQAAGARFNNKGPTSCVLAWRPTSRGRRCPRRGSPHEGRRRRAASCHTSHVTCHTLRVTCSCYTLHVTCYMFPMMSSVPHLFCSASTPPVQVQVERVQVYTSHVTHPVTHRTSHVTCYMLHVHVACYMFPKMFCVPDLFCSASTHT